MATVVSKRYDAAAAKVDPAKAYSVEDINPERGRMKVSVPVFGRPTSVELEYYQVERL